MCYMTIAGLSWNSYLLLITVHQPNMFDSYDGSRAFVAVSMKWTPCLNIVAVSNYVKMYENQFYLNYHGPPKKFYIHI